MCKLIIEHFLTGGLRILLDRQPDLVLGHLSLQGAVLLLKTRGLLTIYIATLTAFLTEEVSVLRVGYRCYLAV